MTTQERQRHWFHLTPVRFFIGLLAVQVFLLVSHRVRWFPLSQHKGYTVLIAVGVVGVAIVAMLVWGLGCVLFRRRFHFSFRSLLLFVVVLSVAMGWFAWKMERARKQRGAVERILELGGNLGYDFQVDETGNWIEGAEPTAPEWLRKLLGDDFFCEVVSACAFCAPTFGDDEARHLKRLTGLEHLYLSDTQISDSGLAHLEGLTKLETLSLQGTQISDSGLAHLEGLTRLDTLYLNGTQVTDDGVKKLQEALPNCKIFQSPP